MIERTDSGRRSEMARERNISPRRVRVCARLEIKNSTCAKVEVCCLLSAFMWFQG